jgi:hypothetical protein
MDGQDIKPDEPVRATKKWWWRHGRSPRQHRGNSGGPTSEGYDAWLDGVLKGK